MVPPGWPEDTTGRSFLMPAVIMSVSEKLANEAVFGSDMFAGLQGVSKIRYTLPVRAILDGGDAVGVVSPEHVGPGLGIIEVYRLTR